MFVMSVDPAELLRQQGFKVTAQRLAVLRAVSGQPHRTAEDVFEVVRAQIDGWTIEFKELAEWFALELSRMIVD
jgi:Fe2+ or Zn2+ uptake regulation protein